MNRQDLEARLKRTAPLQTLVAVFRKDGIVGLMRLRAYDLSGDLRIHPDDETVACAVVISRDWDGDQNRRVRFSIRSNQELVATAIADSLEGLELYGDHDLKPLITSRIKKREEARTDPRGQVLG